MTAEGYKYPSINGTRLEDHLHPPPPTVSDQRSCRLNNGRKARNDRNVPSMEPSNENVRESVKTYSLFF